MIFIDLTSYQCPMPLIKIKLLIKNMAKDDCLHVLLFDSGSRQDVPVFLKKKGYQVETEHKNDGTLSLLIRLAK